MSDSPEQHCQLSPKHCPPTEAPSPLSLPTASTIASFQILPQELTYTAKHNPHAFDFSTLLREKIDPLHRLKLLKWLHSQAVRQSYYRQVFAYAIYYLDRYLALSERVQLEELQVLAFGALLLATKIQGAVFPRLGKIFDTDLILAAEERICLKLNYFLHPKTYVHMLSELTAAWDNFANKEELYKDKRYLKQSLAGFHRYRALHERMECVYMAPQSHRFPVPSLTINLFFLQNKINMEDAPVGERSLETLLAYIRNSYDILEGYRFMFNEFLESVDEMEGELNQEMGIYLSNFLTLPVGQDPPNRRCANYDSFLRMQTTTEEGIKMLDKLARRKEKP